jgi:RecA/RadA recombinase
MTDVRTLEADMRQLKQAVRALAGSATNQALQISAINDKTQRVGVTLPTLAAGVNDVTGGVVATGIDVLGVRT